MRVLLWLVGVILIVGGLLYVLNNYIYQEKQGDTSSTTQFNESSSMQHNGVEVIPIEHATGILRWGGKVVYFDPVGGAEAFAGQPAPDIVLVTHIHGDHFDPPTLSAVLDNASLIVPQSVKDELPAELAARATVLNNGGTLTEQGFTITAVPAYNLPGTERSKYHPKSRGDNGYILERDGTRVYIAGDTAGTPEMRALTNIDIAFVPMNLPYTMSIDEAADAVLAFKPAVVYPYHYRGPGGLADVERFKELVEAGNAGIEVVLAGWYPN